MAFTSGFIISIAQSKTGPVEEREIVTARAETREESRAIFFVSFLALYMHFIGENFALAPQLGYDRYPGIHTFIGKQTP